jgi:pyruvate,water dikinase
VSTIRWLGDDDCHHPEFVGGKAASLSRLAALHAVPPGFAIPAIPATQSDALHQLRPAIGLAYERLGERCGGPNPPVAVRSSAIDEDGGAASFAGQHDTFLNIRGAEALIDAVARCVLSASSDVAASYRSQRGLSADDVKMGVLVQQLVHSDVSAVAFSANPVTGDHAEIMINANWGLGESIVSGTTTPDMFVVSKSDFRVASRDVALKSKMTVLTEAGTTEADVPAPDQAKPSLTDGEIVEIARLALMLEQACGHAVDVECAIARNQLYLLQCRPITTLG